MKKMNIPLIGALLVVSLVVCPILYIHVGPALDAAQLSALRTLGIIAGSSALFCFVVGELTGNNSQMDKLWSILPVVYTWVIAVNGGMSARLVVMAILATLWGISRHPNYLAEQSIWACFYIFSIGAGVGILNWSIIGALLLIVLFIGSSALAEEISGGKYPEYAKYCEKVSKFFPGKRYTA